jgi:hypothetical protein
MEPENNAPVVAAWASAGAKRNAATEKANSFFILRITFQILRALSSTIGAR